MRRQKTSGWLSSNTMFIEFDNVYIPKENLIGKEGKGFAYTMLNFNHERFTLATQANRYARCCYEEALEFSRKRKTFGKRLIDHQVIRHKLMEMVTKIESNHNLLENYCYQVKSGISDKKLFGYVALMKVNSTKTMEYCAREGMYELLLLSTVS